MVECNAGAGKRAIALAIIDRNMMGKHFCRTIWIARLQASGFALLHLARLAENL